MPGVSVAGMGMFRVLMLGMRHGLFLVLMWRRFFRMMVMFVRV
jgi:hypothetical protein